MLEGLEIKTLNLSEVNNCNETFRLDSEFFEKESYTLDIILKAKKHFFLKNKEVVSGPFGSTLKSESYLNTGIPFIRIENIKGGFTIDKSNMVYISEEDNQILKNSQLTLDDIVMSKVGNSIGYYARIDEDILNCNISENNLGIKLKEYPDSLKHYILAYLNSKHGKKLTLRRRSGNAQPKLNVDDLTKIPIPSFTTLFYNHISQLITSSNKLKYIGLEKYQQAEILLLKELGLENFKPTEEAVNIKSFKDSFATTCRLDAEYYQLKYEDYERLIKQYTNGYDRLTNIITLNDTNFVPTEYQKHQYIELSNIGNMGDIMGCTVDYGVNLPSRARRLVKEHDVIISSIEGSLSSCAIITKDYDNSICSTGFYVINSQVINSETLLVLFKSTLMQNLLKQSCSGTILTAINKEEFTKLYIPIIKNTTQQQIATLIKESFALKSQSEHLLEVAKQAVEIAIEQSEEAALAFIEQKSKPLESYS